MMPHGYFPPRLFANPVLLLLSTTQLQVGSAATDEGPCDIYDAAPEGSPCVAAHSTVRALYGKYHGPLYQVRRGSDNTTLDVETLSPGGYANSAAQDKFCAQSACHIWKIYDQSPKMNHLDIAPPGGAHREQDAPANATKEPLMVGGHKVYAAVFEGGMG